MNGSASRMTAANSFNDKWASGLFDFQAAFRCPTRIMNDAITQAMVGYEGGRMLFLGFGTALGAVSILDSRVYPIKLGHLPFSKRGLI
jgi:polyphosphate glucokinase